MLIAMAAGSVSMGFLPRLLPSAKQYAPAAAVAASGGIYLLLSLSGSLWAKLQAARRTIRRASRAGLPVLSGGLRPTVWVSGRLAGGGCLPCLRIGFAPTGYRARGLGCLVPSCAQLCLWRCFEPTTPHFQF